MEEDQQQEEEEDGDDDDEEEDLGEDQEIISSIPNKRRGPSRKDLDFEQHVGIKSSLYGIDRDSNASNVNTSKKRQHHDSHITEAELLDSHQGSRLTRHKKNVILGLPNQQQSSEESEEEEEEEGPRKYRFRNRETTKRETMNIQTLGGDGGGYRRKETSSYDRNPEINRVNYKEQPAPRLYMGGRIPNPQHHSNRYNPRHSSRHQRRDNHSSRRHFDSSSESGSSSNNDIRHRRRGKRRGGNHGSSGDEDSNFNNYENDRLSKERDSIQPINMSGMNGGMGGSVRDKASERDLLRVDATPVAVDSKIGFGSIGGLDRHILSLKEMLVLPLLYPDVFERFDTQPPRGVLFTGPPGTGKTLTARALANSLSSVENFGGRKVSFFMRKGADCLSKWVGEGERQLRLLFEQAKKMQPSIIFFDEIDGLAPVRSVKQDQIHASIVSTLLALMDGLDSRGQVVVIGATNRPDAIDPALRRPGRFDRELTFSLPDASGRAAIIDIHTSTWKPPLSIDIKKWIVENTVGYCGADIKSFCSEATLVALRRTYPQVYNSSHRLTLDLNKLNLSMGDFAAALKKVIPSSHKTTGTPAKPLDNLTAPLLKSSYNKIVENINILFPAANSSVSKVNTSSKLTIDTIRDDNETWIASLTDVQDVNVLRDYVGDIVTINDKESTSSSSCWNTQSAAECAITTSMWSSSSITSRPRLMIKGLKGMGQSELAGATLQYLESIPSYCLDFPSLLSDIYVHSAEQSLVTRVQAAFHASPSVIYLPDLTNWWKSAPESMRTTLITLIESTPSTLPVLWLTSLCKDAVDNDYIDENFDEDKRLQNLIKILSGEQDISFLNNTTLSKNENNSIIFLNPPSIDDRNSFFQSYFDTLPLMPAKIYAARKKILTSRMQLLVASEPIIIDQSSSLNNLSHIKKDNSNNDDDNDQYIPDEDIHKILPDERDESNIRDLRTFLRASLSELHKERKLTVFCRPVDPEMVLDYYDVITCPMDLETMRMKVDNKMYPTLRHFLRDIDQIVFNAKEYNPMTLKDQRGRAIVHSANSMSDIIESYAYNFKKEVGYDVFKKCIEIARKNRIRTKWGPIVSQTPMPKSHLKFYSDILNTHERVKEEEGDEHPTAIKLKEAQLEELKNIQKQEKDRIESEKLPPRRSTRGKIEEGDDDEKGEDEKENDDDDDDKIDNSYMEEDSLVEINSSSESINIDEIESKEQTEVMITDSNIVSNSNELSENQEIENDSSEIGLNEQIEEVVIEETMDDINALPIMISLQNSIISAQQMYDNNEFILMHNKLIQLTEGWNVSRLIGIITSKYYN
jgi:SpoVK/Ycf46/Vps4 family AAA+-type ATPase